MKYSYLVLLLLVISSGIIRAQNNSPTRSPKWEVRAVWLTTVSGLDWPHSLNIKEQQQSLRSIVDQLAAARYNTIFFQVRGRGDAMYRSAYEPWSSQLTGTVGKDPGWDPLQFIIDEAHSHSMEVHAWFNTFLVKNGSASNSRHVVEKHKEWIHVVGGESWLDPGIPAAREYTLKVAMDIVRNYDVDGVHFDFMRYPEGGFSDDAAYKRYGNRNMTKSDWRRQNINAFISAFYDSATALKPRLKIGSAPIGIYHNVYGMNGLQSYDNLFQDSREWLRKGWQDYIVPQVYWALGKTGGHPDFALVTRDWSANTFGRQIYIGLGIYKSDVALQVARLIDTTRAYGFPGNSFFRYEFLAKMPGLGGRYDYPAFIPPMPWKDSIPPNPPQHLHIKPIADNYFRLSWASPLRAKDGDNVKGYNIYRSTTARVDINDIKNYICSVKNSVDFYIDTISHPSSAKYTYAVTAMDAGNNESLPTHEESVTIPEIVQLAKKFATKLVLGQSYPLLASEYVYVSYELSEQSPVWLTIYDSSQKEVLRVVNAVQEPGRYIAGAHVEKLKDGDYSYKLTAGQQVLTRTFVVTH